MRQWPLQEEGVLQTHADTLSGSSSGYLLPKVDASGVGWGGGWKRAGDSASIFSSLSHKDLQFLKLFLSCKHWVHCFNTKARILNCFLIRSNLYKGWMQLIKKKQSSEQIVGWFQTLTTRASFCDLKVFFFISLILLEKKETEMLFSNVDNRVEENWLWRYLFLCNCLTFSPRSWWLSGLCAFWMGEQWIAPFCCQSPHEEALPACSVMFPCYGVDWSGVLRSFFIFMWVVWAQSGAR